MLDLDTEAKVLNAMCSFTDCLDLGMIEVKPEYFSESLNRHIFQTMKGMYVDGKAVTLNTVYEQLKATLAKNHTRWLFIDQSFCSSAEFKVYVRKLADLLKRRRLHSVAQSIVSGVNNGDDTAELLATVQNDVYAISLESESKPIITPKKHAERILETVSRRMEKKNPPGVMTSIYKLNKMLNSGCGYQQGELIIYAAKTGKGKTAFATAQSKDIAVTQSHPTLYINTEMNDEQVDLRLACLMTGIDYGLLATGEISDQQYNLVLTEINRLNDSSFYSVTEPELTIDGVVSMAKRFKAQKGLRFLVVDYVGRMETMDAKLKEHQVLKVIAKRLKTLAQVLGVTVIMLAQLTEEEYLAGARAMKDESDLYAFLREMDEGEQLEYAKLYNYFLVVDKNRNGPTGKIPLNFIKEKMIFKGEEKGENARLGTVESESRGNRKSYGSKGSGSR